MNKNSLKFPFVFVIAMVLLLSACKKDNVNPVTSQSTAQGSAPALIAPSNIQGTDLCGCGNNFCGNVTQVNFIAGQNMTAGAVYVANDANNLYVTYYTIGGWSMSELHLYVGDCALIPVNGSGNPQPGHFPYSVTFNKAVTQYIFTIPLSSIPTCFCVAAHGVVSGPGGTQTAWGQGTPIVAKGNWAMKFSACKQNCSGE